MQEPESRIQKLNDDSFKTGPAISQEEAECLAALMRDPNWNIFEDYLKRIRDDALKKVMYRTGLSPEIHGYWKGAWNTATDIINLPKELGKQIYTETPKQGDTHELENF